MWKNYLKTAIRSIRKNRFFTSLNILGLTIGIAAFIVLILYVEYEYSYDTHFKDADRIYRVTLDMEWAQAPTQYTAVAPGPTAHHLPLEYPEVESGTRFTFLDRQLFEYKSLDAPGKVLRFYEDQVMATDSNFFKVFDLKIVKRDKKSMLQQAGSVVISEALAKKYFGNANPINKVFTAGGTNQLVVKGVMENLPRNSHFYTEIIVAAHNEFIFDINNWRNLSLFNYIKFKPNADIESFNKKLEAFRDKYYATWKDHSTFRVQRMLDIHLKNDRIFDFAITTDITLVYFLMAIAFLILMIASINFMNLSTARSVFRSKEVGVRKVIGAGRKNLVFQFLAESIIIVIASVFLSIVIVESILPLFKNIIGVHLSINYHTDIIRLVLFAIVLGLFSGMYPAFYTSAFKPLAVLKGNFSFKGGNATFRKVLVIFQFVIMVVLLCVSSALILQMNYINNRDLGFTKENIIIAQVDNDPGGKLQNRIKQELIDKAGIESISLSNMLPGTTAWGDHFMIDGSREFFPMRTLNVGYDYLDLLEIKLSAGRNFSKEFATDSTACIINESAAKKFNWSLDEAIGKSMSWNFAESWDNQIFGKIIGVVKDYHFKSFHEEIEPLVLTMNQTGNNLIAIKFNPQNEQKVIQSMELVFNKLNPEYPFEYKYLSHLIDDLYTGEKLFGKVFQYFVFLAIIIACLGLIGLSAFVTEKKFKEVGVRKTFGASVSQIVFLFTREFAFWVIIANIIGWPIAWFIIKKWLENFAYHMNISWWIFPLVLLVTLMIAIFTVSYLAIIAAKKNPVEAIKYE